MTVLEAVNDLKAKCAIRDELMAEFNMLTEVLTQGIDISQVAAFSWDTKLVPARDMQRASTLARSVYPAKLEKEFPWYGEWLGVSGKPAWYNYVVMKDGTRKPLKPYIKAV